MLVSFFEKKIKFDCKFRFVQLNKPIVLGHAAQSVTCLTADLGVASSILARYHTFGEIDHKIISTAIHLPSADSRRIVVSYKRTYLYEVLVKVGVHTIWCHFGQFKFVQKDHFQRNTNQSYISI